MFVFTTHNIKKLPLKTKIGLFLTITLGITLLFLFGITFLIFALIGGLITFFGQPVPAAPVPLASPGLPGSSPSSVTTSLFPIPSAPKSGR